VILTDDGELLLTFYESWIVRFTAGNRQSGIIGAIRSGQAKA
jgi:hypothetical protein